MSPALRLLAVAFLLIASARAGAAGWWVEPPPDDAAGDGDSSAPDKVEFWDRLQERAFDELCKVIEVPVSQKLQLGENALTSVGYHRRLRRLPTGNFAVLDQAKLGLSLGWAQTLVELVESPIVLSFTARLEGESFILRPLESKKSCDEVDRLLNPLDVKTTIPFSGERISEMMVGEIWKMPLTLTIGGAVGAGRDLISSLPITISVGASGQGRSSVSLHRLSEDKLRFRLRLDQALIRDATGGVAASIATYQFGLPEAENVLLKLLNRELARQLNRYLALALNGGGSGRQGVNSVLEFVLDPRDREAMERLSKALAGDLGVLDQLGKIAREARDRLVRAEAMAEDVASAKEEHEAALDAKATFAGMDEYDRDRRSWGFRLPLLFRFGGSTGSDEDKITILDEAGGRYKIYQADKTFERGFLDIPFLGQIFKNHQERSVRAFTYRDATGAVQEPVALYVEQQGFLRAGPGAASALARRTDELLRLAGTRGEGRDERGGLPIERIVPPPPGEEDSDPSYPRGMSALTLGFNQKAIADILDAGTELVLKAYANTLTGLARNMLQWVLANGRVVGERLEYDTFRLLEAMGFDWHSDQRDSDSARAEVSRHAETAMEVARDVAKAALAQGPDARAQAVRDLLAGKGESGLAYDEILKVLVQLVDPLDLSGEFYAFMSRDGRGPKDVRLRLKLHGRPQDPLLEAAAHARNRFADPSLLLD